jgi:hypothetical protein
MQIELATQEKILIKYMNNIHPQRQHNNDLSWMNKNDKKKKELMIKKHTHKLETLIQQQHQSQPRRTTANQPDTTNVVNLSNIPLKTGHAAVVSQRIEICTNAEINEHRGHNSEH